MSSISMFATRQPPVYATQFTTPSILGSPSPSSTSENAAKQTRLRLHQHLELSAIEEDAGALQVGAAIHADNVAVTLFLKCGAALGAAHPVFLPAIFLLRLFAAGVRLRFQTLDKFLIFFIEV